MSHILYKIGIYENLFLPTDPIPQNPKQSNELLVNEDINRKNLMDIWIVHVQQLNNTGEIHKFFAFKI